MKKDLNLRTPKLLISLKKFMPTCPLSSKKKYSLKFYKIQWILTVDKCKSEKQKREKMKQF